MVILEIDVLVFNILGGRKNCQTDDWVRLSWQLTHRATFVRFAGAPVLPVAATLLADVDSYKKNSDWW